MSATMMLRNAAHGPEAVPPAMFRQAPPEIAPLQHFAPDEGIFAEGDPAGGMYRVVSGMVRACKFLSDGRRHIDAFYKPGDVFGFELGREYLLSTEAVTACTLAKLRRPAAETDPPAASQLYAYAMRCLAQAQAHSQLLGRYSAGQKLASFLLDMSGTQSEVMELPMARHDIADYLGLTIETVSRTLAQFEKEGLLVLITARRIRLLDRKGLAALCG